MSEPFTPPAPLTKWADTTVNFWRRTRTNHQNRQQGWDANTTAGLNPGNIFERVSETTTNAPRKWEAPRRIWVNSSVTDFFEDQVDLRWVQAAWYTISLAPWHTWLICTAYPHLILSKLPFHSVWRHLSTVWLGVYVEDQKSLEARLGHLLQVNCSVRFIYYKPAKPKKGQPQPGQTLDLARAFYLAGYPTNYYQEDDSSRCVSYLVVAGAGVAVGKDKTGWLSTLVEQCNKFGIEVVSD